MIFLNNLNNLLISILSDYCSHVQLICINAPHKLLILIDDNIISFPNNVTQLHITLNIRLHYGNT